MKEENASLILNQSRVAAVAAPRTMTEAGSPVPALANGLELAAIGAMWLLLPFWPLAIAALTGDRGCVRRYGATLRLMVRHIRAQYRSRSIARMLAYRLAWRGSQAAEWPSGACSHCGRCCLERDCIFLAFGEQGQSSCRIYGGRLWRLLSCGDYPRHGQDIALYDCPAFRVVRGPARTIRRAPNMLA
jgi:hypothetical protein